MARQDVPLIQSQAQIMRLTRSQADCRRHMCPLIFSIEKVKVGKLAEKIDVEQEIQSAIYVSDQVTMPETAPSNGSDCSFFSICCLRV